MSEAVGVCIFKKRKIINLSVNHAEAVHVLTTYKV